MKMCSYFEAAVPDGMGIGSREGGLTLVVGVCCCLRAGLMAAPIERLLSVRWPRGVTIFARGDESVKLQ